MAKINIYETGWLNMVFEGRNKNYGAYQLRAENPKTTLRALFSALFLIGGTVAIPVSINYFTPKDNVAEVISKGPDVITPVDLTPLKPKAEPEKPKDFPGESKPITNQKVIKYVNFVTTEKDKATDDVPINKELEGAQIGQINNDGPNTSGNVLETTTRPTENGTGNDISGNTVETTATLERQPLYPGGLGKFVKDVSEKFKTPELETDAKTLKVLVNFVIEKDGTLSNIKVIRDPGHNLGKEALRVLNSMKTKWSPGYKNGEPVRTSFNLPIVINIQ
ncbi:energy transducer TonB [Flavobacterium suncheonense]|uniref:energy transducer TonB n=1 Tax=Flavobacterium suncheonense TaxID=350894 RepID=UPI003FA36235